MAGSTCIFRPSLAHLDVAKEETVLCKCSNVDGICVENVEREREIGRGVRCICIARGFVELDFWRCGTVLVS